METDLTAAFALGAALFLYIRGWLYGRSLIRSKKDFTRLSAFSAGLGVVFIALASPLDSLDTIFLSAHMAQHLLLMMVAPPLILLGKPFLPLLRGLPKTFVKEGLAPFFRWPALKNLSSPIICWLVFALSTIVWHLPYCYELALHSSTWHGVQHAFFFWSGIWFWWPIFENREKFPSWVFIPYLLFADLINTALSAFFVFSGRSFYPSYTSADDQILAGLIMWVPGSFIYLVPAFLLAMRVFSGKTEEQFERVHKETRKIVSWLPAIAKHRRWFQAALLLLALFVMADGWFGKQITPMNLAGTLPWIYWRGLSILALLTVGNLFCMACPFILVRDIGRKFIPPKLRWPRSLRNKWLAGTLFVTYLWAYEAFSLWNSPWLTAWIVAGYFLTALLIDGFFRGASFCKYVCPIGQFHFVVSTLSPREIGVKQPAVCQSCKTFDCIKGNEKFRGCELDLFQPKKIGNLDCTFCLDCVTACPHHNVALVSIAPAKTLLSGQTRKRTDWLVLIALITFGAYANAAGMVDPVMMWAQNRSAKLAFVLAVTVIAPGVLFTASGMLSFGMKTFAAIRKFSPALAPLGISLWAAHVAYHALAAFFDVIPLEILLLNGGVLIAVYLIWKAAQGSLRLAAPWATLAIAMYAAALWILFQPMQMRGMM